MTRALDWFLDLLRNPSDFRYDPWGFLRNQGGHAYVVGGGLALLDMELWQILLGYALWEAIQFTLFWVTTLFSSFETKFSV